MVQGGVIYNRNVKNTPLLEGGSSRRGSSHSTKAAVGNSRRGSRYKNRKDDDASRRGVSTDIDINNAEGELCRRAPRRTAAIQAYEQMQLHDVIEEDEEELNF